MENSNIPSSFSDGYENKDFPKKKGGVSFVKEVLKFALLALVIVLPIRIFIAQPFIVSGESMDPSFETGHYLIVDQLTYRFEKPQRGDVIVFKFPKDTSKYFIKRIIGLPNETLEIQNGQVSIRNSQEENVTEKTVLRLEEPYIFHERDESSLVILKDNEYFVMGDNRKSSHDSRAWGPLNEKFIIGRALVRLFPLNQINLFPENYKFIQK